MADLLNTGVSALLASQRGLATTSHNIANANTEGYSRQRINLATRPPFRSANNYIGQGVSVTSTQRINNQFLQSRLEQSTSEHARLDTYHEMIGRIDVLLAEENSGLATVQTEFFNSIQDLNTHPTSVGARQTVLNLASSLADQFNSMQGQLDALQTETNKQISSVVNEINSIAKNITDLNEKIVRLGGSSSDLIPNDLLDQRDLQLTELAKLTSIQTVEMGNGSVNVFVGNGINLVSETGTVELSVAPNTLHPEQHQVVLSNAYGDRDISNQLTGGKLGGLFDFRREALNDSMNQLGRLAVVLADQFNQQHITGLTLEGDRGGNFFTLPSIESQADPANTGTASIDVSFTDTTALSTSDYKLSFDGVAYTLTRLHDNSSVSGAGPLSMDGIEVTVSGAAAAGDSFIIRPTHRAAIKFDFELTGVNDIALSSPIRSDTPVSNIGTAETSTPVVLDPNDPNLTDRVQIRFNDPPDTFDVINTDSGATLGSGLTYTKGQAIEYQGWRVEISGEPQANDLFVIEANIDGTGNNQNGLMLANLQSDLLIEGKFSLLDGYGALISHVGSNTKQAKISSDAMNSMLQNVQASREAVSGVNLDEEAINLTRYQQSYQAAAQVISAADNLFQTLLRALG